ncbi:hypothetical protein EV363DRAFT_1325201 [Boletus edulis]|nr:hypothetical protein EV363DRAFT_1325201 [Boletus edulis]
MVRLHPKSHPLLDYALDDALAHFGHLGSTFKSVLHDVTVLAEDVQRHSWIWDHVCIPGRWDTWGSRGKPRWPTAVHDLLLYILVAFASDSFMEAFLRRITLKPKKGTNPLVYAAYFDKDEHARMLLSVGARLNQRGWETVGYRCFLVSTLRHGYPLRGRREHCTLIYIHRILRGILSSADPIVYCKIIVTN